MPDLFSPFRLKSVTVRNRIAMSPMTMYRSIDGKMDDYHLMYLGARAAGGFGLVFPEQVAVSPEGRTGMHCAGIYEDSQIEGHLRVTSMIKCMGAVAGIQLGHTGRRGSRQPPWNGGAQIPPGAEDGWQVVGPSAVPWGGVECPPPVHPLTVSEIKVVQQQYVDAAQRSLDAGYQWLELHFAHGYLGASFLSPLANQRTDEYGGSLENRTRFHREILEAVRQIWPDSLPLTVRLGADDFHPGGVTFEESIVAIGWMRECGLDLVDLSMGGNTADTIDDLYSKPSAWVERSAQVKREVGIPTATSWNLGVPRNADAAVRSGATDIVLLGRPALANAHWPIWAARELGHQQPFDLLPRDWGWWLKNFRGDLPSIGWPEPSRPQGNGRPEATREPADGCT